MYSDAPRAKKIEGVSDAVQVASGRSRACARNSVGEVICWDEEGAEQVAGVIGAIDVAVGPTMACAALRSGRAVCWATRLAPNTPPIPTEVGGVQDAVKVAAGFYHACALTRAGQVRCWGDDSEGQVGVGSKDAVVFSSGYDDGEYWVAEELLGDGKPAGAVADAAFRKYQEGRRRSILWCLAHGGGVDAEHTLTLQLGFDDAGRVDAAVLAASDLEPAQAVDLTSCVQGSYVVPDLLRGAAAPAPLQVRLWMAPVWQARLKSAPVFDDAIALSARGYLTCAVSSDGEGYCWGASHALDGPGVYGTQLEARDGPGYTDLTNLEDISVGWRQVCGRRRDGGHTCMGANGEGQFGDGPPYSKEYTARSIDHIGKFAYVSVGPTLDCGITVDGHVMCWGNNDGGRLGIGSTRGGPQRAALVQGLPQATLSPP